MSSFYFDSFTIIFYIDTQFIMKFRVKGMLQIYCKTSCNCSFLRFYVKEYVIFFI